MHKSQFEKALTLSHVPRWVIVDTMKEQTVADHSFRTMMISLEIADRIHGSAISTGINKDRLLLMAALHDIDEGSTGDIPTPFKRSLTCVEWPDQDFKEDGVEGAIVAMADVIEAVTFLQRYGVSKSGKVMNAMWPNVEEAKNRLIAKAVAAYSHNMPGMDQELLTVSMSHKIKVIVDEVLRTVAYYE